MNNAVFVVVLGLILKPLLWWACKVLPRERWQILAAVPTSKATRDGCWHGANLTYYGLWLATGSLGGVMVFFLLLAAVAVPPPVILGLVAGVMLAAVAAAKLLARVVENKRNTLTVAGAAVTGLVAMPLLVAFHNRLAPSEGQVSLALLPVMAALAVAYLLGEGIGRLACISFGCCYGRPVAELGPWGQRIFSRFHTIFQGRTKKISYASGLDGVKVVPIQAITSCCSVGVGLVGMYLYLEGQYTGAFLLAALFAFGWRIFSERLRADYRGNGSFTAYQQMALAGLGYCLLLAFAGNHGLEPRANLTAGFVALWQPSAILFFQALWLALFLYTGLSRVTGATVAFHVRQERV